MKTGIITCALTALALSAGITSHAQTVSDKKAKRQKEEIVNVRVWLNKGEDKVIDGSDKYVKRLVKMYGALGGHDAGYVSAGLSFKF